MAISPVKELGEMVGTIKLKVPQLLTERNLKASDLMFGARLAPATAYRIASGDAESISFGVLGSLCDFFGVGVGDILEYVSENGEEQSS